MSKLVESTLLLLQEQSVCQQIESDSDDDVDAERVEVLIMDAVSDILPALAKVMGSSFAPIFAKLFEPLMKFSVSEAAVQNPWLR